MKRAAVIIVILALARSISAEITSADLKHCPDGHATLKDVPIHYGLWAGTERERKEMERHVAKLDYVQGGDELPSANPPRYRPICTTCRFAFDSVTKTWNRSSSDPRSFKRPFTWALQEFPTLQNRKGLDYAQWVRESRLVKESLNYTAPKESSRELKRSIAAWVHRYAPKAKYSRNGSSLGCPEWQGPGLFIELSDERDHVWVWVVHDVNWSSPNHTMQTCG